MTEMISPFNERSEPALGDGRMDIDFVPGLARLSKELARQAAMIGYLDAFAMYTAGVGCGGAARPAGAPAPGRRT